MPAVNGPSADLEWPQDDGWRTLAGWIWFAYFALHALFGAWLLA